MSLYPDDAIADLRLRVEALESRLPLNSRVDPPGCPACNGVAGTACRCAEPVPECCTDGTCPTCAPLMAWTDYRKDYQPRDTVTASKAFRAGWEASREYHRDTPEPELVFEPCACKEVTLARGQLEKVTDSRYRRTTHYRECCNVVSPIPKPEPVPQSYVESLESRIKVALALCEAWDDNAADAIEAALRGESA